MIALLGTVFVASLAGSLHCAGMCGGLAAACAPSTGPWVPTLAYHASRGASYAVAGGVAGALGAALEIGGELLGIQRLAGLVAGSAVILAGVALLLRHGGFTHRVATPAWIDSLVRTSARRAMAMTPLFRGVTLGSVSVLLPCGWLWAFLAVAAGAGSSAGGALVMLLFWAGTVPLLAAVGLGVHALGGLWRGRVALVAALAMIVVGSHAVASASLRSEAMAAFRLRAAADPVAAIGRLKTAVHAPPPCCAPHADEPCSADEPQHAADAAAAGTESAISATAGGAMP